MRAFRDVPSHRRAPGALGLGLLLLVNACAHMPFRSSKEAAAREATTMANLQSSALWYADGYVSSVAHACEQAVRESETRNVQLAALRWKLDQATAAYAYATGIPSGTRWTSSCLPGVAHDGRGAEGARRTARRPIRSSRPTVSSRRAPGTWPRAS